jgi:TonB family protein
MPCPYSVRTPHPAAGEGPLDGLQEKAETFLRTLTAMPQNAWTKCFGTALLVFLAAAALAWTPPATAQSKDSPFSKLQPWVMLITPAEGVDFKEYIARLTAGVKRNWYAVMPEVALQGQKGFVVITTRIQQDGTVPVSEPTLERSSGKVELDRAAMTAIRTSAPFEHLPAEFHGPHVELRVVFFYNADTPRYGTNPENSAPPARFLLLHQPRP